MRRSVGVVVALMLTACGSVQTAAQSFISACDGLLYQNVLWSPDGKHIAFEVHSSAANVPIPSDVYVMNPDGTGVHRLNHGGGFGRDLQWLPDGQTLAFTDGLKMFTVTLDGKKSELDLSSTSIGHLFVSPNGNTVAYDDREAIWKENLVDLPDSGRSEPVQLSASATDSLEQWSPDGEYLAFTRFGGVIYTMRADGSDKQYLSKGESPIRWSPNGEWVSYIMSDGDYALFVIKPDGSGGKLVTRDLAYISYGSYSWLPDGRHITYMSKNNELAVINVNTLTVETLTAGIASDLSAPAWSPDGSQVAFISYTPHNSNIVITDIYLVARDGTGQTRLTDNPGNYQCFNWPF